jgi:histidinol phosphatase-like enzyme/predicted kinase
MVLRIGGSARAETVGMRTDGEVVLIMGLPGAGKSTVAGGLVADGYVRLNRDEAGGSLSDLLPALDRAIAAGVSRIVVDNTYVSRQSRASVIHTAARHGLPVRCLWLSTSVEDAQVNAASRILSRYGRLLTPELMRVAARDDVAAFGPTTQFRYQRELEPPTPVEGFSRIDVLRFERRRDPSRRNRAVIVWCDGVLCRGRSEDPAQPAADDGLFAERGGVLRRYQADGWLVLGVSWQPGIDEGVLTAAEVDVAFARMRVQLGIDIEVDYCPHAGGPPKCWCRKPLPGLGVVFIERHGLDPSQCIYVGTGAQDAGFARRLGFQFREAAEFFGSG